MSKMIQIRNVPDNLHKQMKARALDEGLTLSDWAKRELAQIVERPSLKEWLDVAAHWPRIQTKRSAAEIIRELRDSR